ncbi:MAG: hypothetical protein R3Y29_06555 [bacterium]
MEILDVIKKLKELELNDNQNKTNNQDSSQVSILKLNNNFASIKSILPYILEESSISSSTNHNNNSNIAQAPANQNNQVYDFIEILEINELVNSYKKNYTSISSDKKQDLKKEAILYIQSNVNNENKYLVEAIIKMMEINQILSMRGKI